MAQAKKQIDGRAEIKTYPPFVAKRPTSGDAASSETPDDLTVDDLLLSGDSATFSREIVEMMAGQKLPKWIDRRMQVLMDGNTEGTLTKDERAELKSFVDITSSMSLFKGWAMNVLRHLNS